MLMLILRRLLLLVLVFFGITFVTFAIVRLSPGDPLVMLYSPEVLGRIDRERLREQLGLYDSLPVQYSRMAGQLVSGTLISQHEGRATSVLLAERLPVTLLVGGLALILAVVVGVPAGVVSAVRKDSALDRLIVISTTAGLSLPSFWIGLGFILIFSERLRWLPASGIRPLNSNAFHLINVLPHLVMPVSVLTFSLLPWVVRFTRSGMLDVLGQDYIRTARSKGLTEYRVLLIHALANVFLPLVSLIGTIAPILLSGVVVIESVFGLPGLGRLALRAALNLDYPLLLTINMYAALFVLVFSALTDLAYSYLDPRIRFQ